MARLRGLGGATGTTRRLPARARGPDGAARGRRACLRALRRRLRPPSPRHPAGALGRPAAVLHDRRRSPGGRPRRLAVRRARRRPGPERAPAGHVLPDGHRGVRGVQGPPRPARPAQPGRAGPTAAARRGPAPPAGPPAPRDVDGLRVPARRRRPHHGRPPLRRGRQVPRGHVRRGRLHVPVLPGDARREGLHPGPCARAPGDGERHARHARLVLARGGRGARPVPGLQGVLERLPGGRRHGAVQVRGAPPAVRRTAATRRSLRARLVAEVDPPGHERSRSRAGGQHRPPRTAVGAARARRGRHGPAPPDGHVRRDAVPHLVGA